MLDIAEGDHLKVYQEIGSKFGYSLQRWRQQFTREDKDKIIKLNETYR